MSLAKRFPSLCSYPSLLIISMVYLCHNSVLLVSWTSGCNLMLLNTVYLYCDLGNTTKSDQWAVKLAYCSSPKSHQSSCAKLHPLCYKGFSSMHINLSVIPTEHSGIYVQYVLLGVYIQLCPLQVYLDISPVEYNCFYSEYITQFLNMCALDCHSHFIGPKHPPFIR